MNYQYNDFGDDSLLFFQKRKTGVFETQIQAWCT